MAKKEIPFGYISEKDIYLTGFLDFPDRRIGEVKQSEEESIQYFTDRFQSITDKVDSLESDIEAAENKGSYLMKLVHLREKLKKHDGLGDYVPLFDRLDLLESQLEELISANRVRNEEIKTALLGEFENFKKVIDWREATEQILDIKERWLKTGAVEKSKNEDFEKQFSDSMQDFFDRKRAYVEEKKKVIEIRLGKMKSLIDQVRRINTHEPGFNLKRTVEDLRDQWRKVGQVPMRDKRYLEKDFNYKISQLFKQRRPRIQATASPQELRENLEKKKSLLERAIQLEKDDQFHELQEVQKSWQQIGLIPKEDYKELTEKFKTVCEKALEKRFLEQYAQNKDQSYETKNNREKTRFKIILLKELLKRDEKDLHSFSENMDKFSRGQKFDKIMNNKLLNQKRKVYVKKQLLNELKNSLNDIQIQK